MLARAQTAIRVEPTGQGLGADVSGFDPGAMSAEDVAAVEQAILDNLVIRVRGCTIDDVAYTRFAQNFGTIKPSPSFTRSRPTYLQDAPLVTVISNVMEGGQAIGEHADGELNWHTDLGFTEEPSALTMLIAREAPPEGGDTSFANMYKAYESMPEELRARVEGLRIKHQASHNAQGGPRPGYKHITTQDVREMPGPTHPIIRTHPKTGRKALYLGRRYGGYVPGLELERSEKLLNELWAHAARPEHVWTQKWRVGDLIVWDNRATMHRRDSFAGKGRRRMHRLTTLGERPY